MGLRWPFGARNEFRIPGYSTFTVIGRGSSATVFRAVGKRGVAVAIKITDSPAAAVRLPLENASIVPTVASGVTFDGRAFAVMPFYAKGSLDTAITRLGRAPVETVLPIGVHMTSALAAAHARGWAHGSVKPSNILFDDQGAPLLADFGALGNLQSASPDVWARALAYAAPEQFATAQATPASDQYSLALTLRTMLAGAAWQSQHERTLPPLPAYVPADLKTIFTIALSENPADRFASIREFGRALQSIQVANNWPETFLRVPRPIATSTQIPVVQG